MMNRLFLFWGRKNPPGALPASERRRYRRLDQLFPVEFQLRDASGAPLDEWRQGFTQDVSDGGLCLCVAQFPAAALEVCEAPGTTFFLQIHIPVSDHGVAATARPAWVKRIEGGFVSQVLIGLEYTAIEGAGHGRIRRFIGVRRWFKAVAITFLILWGIGSGVVAFMGARLRWHNEVLVRQLVDNAAHQRTLARDRDALAFKLDEMELYLSQADRQVNVLTRELERVERGSGRAATLEASLGFLRRYQDELQSDIDDLKGQSSKIEVESEAAGVAALDIADRMTDKFARWLSVHRNRRTGLVTSFEGDEDVRDWAFTYDQALAAMVFTLRGDPAASRSIFDHYRSAPRIDAGAWTNAYYASTGDPAEFIAHVGPNVWMGIAILQYTKATGDRSYLDLAVGTARWLEKVRDAEGGLKGGATVSWYSTEHNLDAYAFYRMLFALTGEPSYEAHAASTLAWLNKNAYSRLSDPVVRRGKGDATVATDTYAWSISAVGPAALKAAGMDPDEIVDFAIAQCGVATTYKKFDGTEVRVRGFDFARAQNLARGGVVSCEWTAQMVLAFKIMAAYHAAAGHSSQAEEYEVLAREYTTEIGKMVVTSPSPVGQGEICLPYASHEMADTGHGWRTPKGNRTGSVAGTAYAVLALQGFNPLAFEDAT